MISFSHPTPVCFDEKGSSEGHGFPDFSDWCYHRYADTIHEMTEAQRRAYNIKHLGEVSAAVFEAIPKPKDGRFKDREQWHQKICPHGVRRAKCLTCRRAPAKSKKS